MEIVQLDARIIMDQPDPMDYLARQFGSRAASLTALRQDLETDKTYRQVEVFHWPVQKPGWQELANMLEDVQQHSQYFFLVWGADDKWEHKES